MAILVLGILSGIMIGMFINSELQKVGMKSLLKKVKKELSIAYEEGVKYGKVQPKIDRINEISQEQTDRMSSLDTPNASAAHARHKNSIVSIIKQLEEEKLNLLRSFIKDGTDPTLVVLIDGDKKRMKVSELLTKYGPDSTEADKPLQLKTDSNSPVNTRALSIVKNTKENADDGGKPNSSDSTVH